LRILGDPAAAEDASQETFLRVYRHLAKAPDRDEAIAWIYRICTNYCLNELRDRKIRPWPGGPLDREHPGEPQLESLLQSREQAWLVITQVPEKLRAVAYLHHVDGLDQKEVARVLAISRRTVVYRLAEFQARARRLLCD
jgi:RNA polymerase sigma-70 factor (ECF subfamily)